MTLRLLLPSSHISLARKRFTYHHVNLVTARNCNDSYQRIAMPSSPSAGYVKILKELGDSNAWDSLEKTTKFLDETIPNKGDRDDFQIWAETQRSPTPEYITPDTAIDLIKSTNFATQSDDLLAMLQFRSPYIPIGVINGGSFRLSPDPFYLQSEFDDENHLRASSDDPDEFCASEFTHSILNVCLSSPSSPAESAQSGKHKYDGITRSSDMSSKPSHAKSPDHDSTLTFHQLGMLEYYLGKGQAFDDSPKYTNDWSTTHFGVVVQITDNFKAGGIYLICNFRREHDDGYTLRVDEHGHSNWGRLTCDINNQFSCAKIADSIDCLGKDSKLKLEIMSRSPFKLTHMEWMSRMKACALEGTKQSGSHRVAHANTNGNGPDLSKMAINSGSVTVGR